LLHRSTKAYLESSMILHCFLHIEESLGWAMLGSNQRPLPCEGSVIVCWRFLELAKYLQITAFLRSCFSQGFRGFTRVAGRLLHTTRRMLQASGGRFRVTPRRTTMRCPNTT
jgi:hypothetical protein